MDFERAIRQGIDSARTHRKEGPSPYHQMHPLFKFWWHACVMKSDVPFLSESAITKAVKARLDCKKYK